MATELWRSDLISTSNRVFCKWFTGSAESFSTNWFDMKSKLLFLRSSWGNHLGGSHYVNWITLQPFANDSVLEINLISKFTDLEGKKWTKYVKWENGLSWLTAKLVDRFRFRLFSDWFWHFSFRQTMILKMSVSKYRIWQHACPSCVFMPMGVYI